MFEYPLTEKMLQEQLGEATVARGTQYWRQGRVSDVQFESVHAGCMGLTSAVQGGGLQIYRVEVTLQSYGKNVIIDGDCSCPVSYNCKHVAATLLAWRNGAIENGNAVSITENGEQIALDAWLDQWQRATQHVKKSEQKTRNAQQVFFVLDLYQSPRTMFTVSIVKQHPVKKNGSPGKLQALSLPYQLGERHFRPAWVQVEDVPLLKQLQVLPKLLSQMVALHGARGMAALRSLLETGRCHWQNVATPALCWGESVAATPGWVSNAQGQQQFQLLPGATLLPTTPPCVLDLATHSVRELQCGLPPHLSAQLIQMPALSGTRLWQFLDRVREHVPNFPLPASGLPERREVTPVPVLRCASLALNAREVVYATTGKHIPYAELFFDYEGQLVAAGDAAGHIQQGDALIARQRAAESLCINRLLSVLKPLPVLLPRRLSERLPAAALGCIGQTPWVDFVTQTVPQLQQDGWRCEGLEALGIEVAIVDTFDIALEQGKGRDWFDVTLAFDAGEQRINLLPLLHKNIERLRHLPNDGFIDLPDAQQANRLYRLPVARAQAVLNTLGELFDQKPDNKGRLRLSSFAALRLNELPVRQWQGGSQLLALMERLRQGLPPAQVQLPGEFAAALRPYQQQGVQWLQTLRQYGLHGLLADDMGLGKTVQTLAHIAIEKAAGRLQQPALIICPTSLLGNWKHEAERFVPGLRVLVHHGQQRSKHHKAFRDYDLIVTSYAVFSRDSEWLAKCDWPLLILDEAQAIKNANSKLSEHVRSLHAEQRICLTGTPMENHLGELWAQMDFLLPGLLGSARQFQRLFRKPIEEWHDSQQHALLTRRIAPFLLRRNKHDVAKELPEKVPVLRTLTLGDKQRDLYESVRIVMQEKVQREIEKKGFQRSQIVILDALLKLRQVCCDPRLLKLPSAKTCKSSAKLEFLRELLPSLIAEGRRILLFSQFTGMLDLIEAEVQTLNIPFVRLDGSTRNRQKPVQSFQNDEVPLFLISLKAGGSGLNLTAADTVIHYDPWWNPAAENQATDRAHRIGQEKTVFVYKLICEGSVEEKILALQEHKQALADGIYQSERTADSSLFNADDLALLLQPLA